MKSLVDPYETVSTKSIGSSDGTSSGTPSQPGERFGRYLVQKTLGQGAFGTVYLAHDEELDRLVAVKVPRRDRFHGEDELISFLDEARTAAKLRHPGIVSVFDAGRTAEGLPFVALAFIEGESLAQALKSQPPSPERAAQLMAAIAEAVAEAHRQGFVHRDLKPANILLDAQGNPHVADFGLAVHENVQRLRAGELAGTVPYMSPEQIRGEVHRLDGRSDIWSLGVILYQMLTGRLPFGGDTVAQLSDEIAHRDPKPPRQMNDCLPKELESICLKAMSKKAAKRYATAKDMADDLRSWLISSSAAMVSPLPPEAKPRATGLVIASLAVVGLLVVATVAWQFVPPRSEAITGEPVHAGTPATPVPQPLRVLSLDVYHLANQNDKSVDPRGILGKDSFSARLRDHVTIEAKLSRPAFAYLIAFRPDGEMEVCFPEEETDIPPLTDHPRYPSVTRGVDYGLNEGAGLWLFTVIASEQPLPAFREWRAKQKSVPWRSVDVPGNTVFVDDGDWLETVTPGNRDRGTRGKGVAALEKKTVTDVMDWLKRSQGAEAIRGIGFGVRGKESPSPLGRDPG
ncbi:MAG: protein kinase [Pirellulaceae bacterium]|nr:protein kinase [Pirellulaceae bacterium]